MDDRDAQDVLDLIEKALLSAAERYWEEYGYASGMGWDEEATHAQFLADAFESFHYDYFPVESSHTKRMAGARERGYLKAKLEKG